MAFLQLQNIGKIYVSETNVSVGIRGVNLSFEKGEFVAITGKSGSGKSTLLNVLSGMDSYEEGEMLIEGEPTSHFLQKDWEAYRERYISFIFQDYNIIESFTVLQNVELALMDIENPALRRKRAISLLQRVGMGSHLHHKGSRLSGGQKQRTVIARALAKESPIILADEPTGNLDSKSSEEIIALLREVAKDKLVIVVTHNFEQVENCATRHIRIFDGAIESDQTIVPPQASPSTDAQNGESRARSGSSPKRKNGKKNIREGIMLGRIRFCARPWLSAFLCILMTLTTVVITLTTAISADAFALFEKNTIFTHIDGRVVVCKSDGGVITDDELASLAALTGACDTLHYDAMLDQTAGMLFSDADRTEVLSYTMGYDAESVSLSRGRYPERADEVVMVVPIYMRDFFADVDANREKTMWLFNGLAEYHVVGVSYYYDNTVTPRMLFSAEGFEIATMLERFASSAMVSYDITVLEGELGLADGTRLGTIEGSRTVVDFDLTDGYGIYGNNIAKKIENIWKENNADTRLSVVLNGSFGSEQSTKESFDSYLFVKELPDAVKERAAKASKESGNGDLLVLSPAVFRSLIKHAYYDTSYTQASLFYASDREAASQIAALGRQGYDAIASYETVERDLSETVLRVLVFGFRLFGWFLCVIFASFFLGLCTTRAMLATKGDIGIMRSMGIPTAVVKISTYVQTLISLVPAFLVTALVCVFIYLNPSTNAEFTFLHAPTYIAVFVVLFLIAVRLSHRYIGKMFNQSVRKTLRGGAKGE